MENCLMNLLKKSERFYIFSRLVLVSIDIYSMIECQVSNVICYNFFHVCCRCLQRKNDAKNVHARSDESVYMFN